MASRFPAGQVHASDNPAPTRAPSARSVNAHLGELELAQANLQAIATELDELRVQRSYRHWWNWIDSRRREPIALAVSFDSRAAAKSAGLELPCKDAVQELRRGGADPSLWPIHDHPLAGPQSRLIVITDPKRLRAEPRKYARLLRDCAGLVAFHSLDRLPCALLCQLPLGLVEVVRRASATQASVVPRGSGSYVLEIPGDASPTSVLDWVVPEKLLPSLRTAILAADLASFSRELQRAGSSGAGRAEEALQHQAARVSRREEERLTLRQDMLGAARSEAASEIKAILSSLRVARNQFDAAELVALATEKPFTRLVERLEVSSEGLPEDVVLIRARRNWWHGTRFAHFGWMFAKKFELQLQPAMLQGHLRELQERSLQAIGKEAVARVKAFNTILKDVSLTYPEDELIAHPPEGGGIPRDPERRGIADNFKMDPLHPDNFHISSRKPPGGAHPESELSKEFKKAAERAFKLLGDAEARGFRVERERKGLLGLIIEARGAVFGLYFILLMVLTLFGPRSDFKWLTGGLLILVVISFGLNLWSQPRQDRAMLADRFEAKLEELRSRLQSFSDRFVKDQLGALEEAIEEQANALEAAFVRALTEVRTRLELIRSPDPTVAPASLTASRAAQADANLQRLATRIREDFAVEFASLARHL